MNPWKVRHKFNARPTNYGGIRFDSKKEAAYFQQLQLAQKNGDLLFFLRQVPFHLTGGVVYRCDFVEFWKSGEVRFVDVKGFRTRDYINKVKQVQEIFPIEIIEA